MEPPSPTNCKKHLAEWDTVGKLMKWDHCRSLLHQWWRYKPRHGQGENWITDHDTFVFVHPPLPLNMATHPQSTPLLHVPRASWGKHRPAFKRSSWTYAAVEERENKHLYTFTALYMFTIRWSATEHAAVYMCVQCSHYVSSQMLTCM